MEPLTIALQSHACATTVSMPNIIRTSYILILNAIRVKQQQRLFTRIEYYKQDIILICYIVKENAIDRTLIPVKRTSGFSDWSLIKVWKKQNINVYVNKLYEQTTWNGHVLWR